MSSKTVPVKGLYRTTDYSLFVTNEANRQITPRKPIEESFQQHGFIMGQAIHTRRLADGRLKVVTGHHRLYYAKALGLPVYFIIDPTDVDLFDLEGGTKSWSLSDYVFARNATGKGDYPALVQFSRKHGLPFGVSASLLGGESAGSGNKARDVKRGTFKASGEAIANEVARIINICRDVGFDKAATSNFVAAISLVLRVQEMSVAQLEKRIRAYPHILRSRATRADYLSDLEAVYNYQSRSGKLNLAFRAEEEARRRQDLTRKVQAA